MKVAVITNHNLGLSFLDYLSELEADTVIYWCGQHTPKIPEHAILRTEKLLWVQKRAISSDELNGKARMKDLFRIVFEKKNNLELNFFAQAEHQLSDVMAESLKNPTDGFDDADVVMTIMDAPSVAAYSHPSGAPAMGELRLKSDSQWFYQDRFFQAELPDTGEIALIEGGFSTTQQIKKIMNWLVDGIKQKKTRRAFWISIKSDPCLSIQDPATLGLKATLDLEFNKEVENFLAAKKQWDLLENYEKAKIPKPAEPIPHLVIFAGHHVSAVDQLINNNKLFLTLEYADFRDVQVQKENAQQELKTISVDSVFVLQGQKTEHSWKYYGIKNEVGYLEYVAKDATLDSIKSDFNYYILPFFRREN